ncbi:MAG: heme biosynthesis HemY N-terminal domain-containing protein [Pseudomonadota bacterium]
MKLLAYILLLGVFTLAAIWLVPYLPGYVLIRIGGWAMETSVIALIVLLILTYFAISGGVWLWNLPGNSARKFVEKRSRAQLELGMLALAEGNWDKAEKALQKSAKNSSIPSVGYIAAAQAAQGPGAEARRVHYLEQAELSDGSQPPVLITRARLMVANDNPEGALEVLGQLPDRHNRPRALDLMARSYERLGRWQELAAITPDLVRHAIIEQPHADRINQRALRERLATAADRAALDGAWKSLPRGKRKDVDLVEARAKRAVELGGGAEFEPELRTTLGKIWSNELCLLYGEIEGGNSQARLKAAEGWLKQQGANPALQLTLGRLCRNAEIWGKAREHLEKAAAGEGIDGAYAALGNLHEALGETEEAMIAYRREIDRLQGGSHQSSQSLPASSTAASSSSGDSDRS